MNSLEKERHPEHDFNFWRKENRESCMVYFILLDFYFFDWKGRIIVFVPSLIDICRKLVIFSTKLFLRL